MKPFLLITLFLISLAFKTGSSSCNFAEGNECQNYNRANVVFLGKVLNIDTIAGDRAGTDLFFKPEFVKFKIIAQYKGYSADTISVKSVITSKAISLFNFVCSYEFEKD